MATVRNQPLARALHQTLVDSARCGNVAALAGRLGVAQSTLYGWAEGRADLPAWAVGEIYRLTHDLDLLTALVGVADEGVILSAAPAAARDPIERVSTAAMRVGGACGRLQADTADALADGLVTGEERTRLCERLTELEREAESLRQVLNAKPFRVVGA